MAARFWVGGTGNWSDAAHWSLTSGGAGGETVPGSGDAVTIDAHASGLNGGTLTIDQVITVQAITWGAAVGTIDNSGNHNVTVTATPWFSGTGTGARTFTGGSATYTLSGNFAGGNPWNMGTVTNLTNPTTAFSSATIVLQGTGTFGGFFQGGGMTYGTATFAGHSSIGGYALTGANTFATLNITAPNWVAFANGLTTTITNAFAWTGTLSDRIAIVSGSNVAVATIAIGSGTATLDYGILHNITASGGTARNATNTLNMGGNAWSSITAPAVGGARVIGG